MRGSTRESKEMIVCFGGSVLTMVVQEGPNGVDKVQVEAAGRLLPVRSR
jgi:hypothetical protein